MTGFVYLTKEDWAKVPKLPTREEYEALLKKELSLFKVGDQVGYFELYELGSREVIGVVQRVNRRTITVMTPKYGKLLVPPECLVIFREIKNKKPAAKVLM